MKIKFITFFAIVFTSFTYTYPGQHIVIDMEGCDQKKMNNINDVACMLASNFPDGCFVYSPVVTKKSTIYYLQLPKGYCVMRVFPLEGRLRAELVTIQHIPYVSLMDSLEEFMNPLFFTATDLLEPQKLFCP